MKIWITRLSANEILFGGLERLQVHFSKPEYHLVVYEERNRDTPFGYLTESHGYFMNYGWIPKSDKIRSVSFGKFFGYCDEEDENKELAKYVWEKVREHFLDVPFGEEWVELEKSGKSKVTDFLIEINLTIGFSPG